MNCWLVTRSGRVNLRCQGVVVVWVESVIELHCDVAWYTSDHGKLMPSFKVCERMRSSVHTKVQDFMLCEKDRHLIAGVMSYHKIRSLDI